MRMLMLLVASLVSSQVLAGGVGFRVVAAPTLGEGALIALAGVLGVAAALAIRRKK